MSGAAAPAETIAGVCGMALEAAGRGMALEPAGRGMALEATGGPELEEAAETPPGAAATNIAANVSSSKKLPGHAASGFVHGVAKGASVPKIAYTRESLGKRTPGAFGLNAY